MSRRFLQLIGASLLVMTVGIASCQALFAESSGSATNHPTAAQPRR